MASHRATAAKQPGALLLDTNVLLVLVVGRHSEDLLESFKRTSYYNRSDYHRIQSHCVRYENSGSLMTTPHILTEVSNLLNQLGEPARQECRRAMASFIAIADERFQGARSLTPLPEFVRFGLADTAIVQLATSNVGVFTDDFALGGLLEKRGVPVLNLRKMRSQVELDVEL